MKRRMPEAHHNSVVFDESVNDEFQDSYRSVLDELQDSYTAIQDGDADFNIDGCGCMSCGCFKSAWTIVAAPVGIAAGMSASAMAAAL